MLHKCANPACSNPFRRLSQGKLFQVETDDFEASSSRQSTPQRRMRTARREHYWLCDQCSSLLTLTFEEGRGMITVPLPQAAGKKPIAPVYFEGLRPRAAQPRIASNGGPQ